jgi:hypothetical protein
MTDAAFANLVNTLAQDPDAGVTDIADEVIRTLYGDVHKAAREDGCALMFRDGVSRASTSNCKRKR